MMILMMLALGIFLSTRFLAEVKRASIVLHESDC